MGGVKALGDQVQHLSGQISSLAGPIEKTTALLAGFGGKAGTQMQRERAAGSGISKIEADPRGVEMFLRSQGMLKNGEKITDNLGHITDMTGILEKIKQVGARGGNMRARLETTHGREFMGLLDATDFKAIREAEGLGPNRDGDHAIDRMKDTPAGKRAQTAIKKDIAMQKVVGDGSWIDSAHKFIAESSAESPIGTLLGISLGSKLLGVGVKALASKAGIGAGAKTAATVASTAETAAPSIATGLGASGLASVGVMAGAVLGTVKVLSDLGRASAAKQGFTGDKSIGKEEADTLASRASKAAGAAASQRSPGANAAMAVETQSKEMREMIATLMKAGAGLQLAQESAAKLIALGQRPTTIDVYNATGGDVQASIRGEQ